jgi:hypothetical protein
MPVIPIQLLDREIPYFFRRIVVKITVLMGIFSHGVIKTSLYVRQIDEITCRDVAPGYFCDTHMQAYYVAEKVQWPPKWRPC